MIIGVLPLTLILLLMFKPVRTIVGWLCLGVLGLLIYGAMQGG